MRTIICKRCFAELDSSAAEGQAGGGTFPALSAIGGIGGVIAGIAMANPLFLPAGLILGLAGDAVCSRCGSRDDLCVAREEEGEEDEVERMGCFLEPPPPVRRENEMSEAQDRQAYGFDNEVPSVVPMGAGDLSEASGSESGAPDAATAESSAASPASTGQSPGIGAAAQGGSTGGGGAAAGGGAASGGGAGSGAGAGGAGGGQ